MAEKAPDFLNEYAGKGFEKLNSDDYQIPFLRILQTLSPQCEKGSEDYIEEASPGMFLNSITNRIYGETINVIPIDFEKTWLEWKPNRGGFVARHEPNSFVPDKTDFSKWRHMNGNIITEHYNFYCILPDFPEDGIIVLSLSSSGIKHAKNWNSQISYTVLPNGEQAPYFSSVWQLKTVFNKNEKGTWYTIGANQSNIKRVRYITKDELDTRVNPSIKLLENNVNLNYEQIESHIKDENDLLQESSQY